MAEEFEEAIKEGKRIAHDYLSGLGWARSARQTTVRHVMPAWTREDREEAFRRDDQRIEDAEECFGKEVDRWRKERTKFAKKVLETIVEEVKGRGDLGFFGKRIIARIKDELQRKRFV